MYKDFFGLDRNPFELSPDPFFMVSSEKSRHALSSISYAVCQRKGFIVMTGEVGTGKTMILRCLFELWEREQIPFAYFIGPRLSTIDFLKYITFELGIEVELPTKGNLLRALYGFLLAQFENGLTTVLVIDEAHQVPHSVLEEIRLLTNFETARQKLVQIILVGQPELDAKLDSVELRSLKQRIAIRCQLMPLSQEEIRPYIERRLELAGANARTGTIFPAETIGAIYRYSAGIPRLINSICDQALIAAFGRGIQVVPVEVIEQVASYFRLVPNPGVSQEAGRSSANQMENFPQEQPLGTLPDLTFPAVDASDPEAILMQINRIHLSGDETKEQQTGRPDIPEAARHETVRNYSALSEASPKWRKGESEEIVQVSTDFDLDWRRSKALSAPIDISRSSGVRPSAGAPTEPLAPAADPALSADPNTSAHSAQRSAAEPSARTTDQGMIDQSVASAAHRRAIFDPDQVFHASRRDQLRRWLQSVLRTTPD